MMRTVDAFVRVFRGGAEYSKLLPAADAAPSITMDASGGIPTSLSGDFAANPDIDWLTDELEPVLVIDGTESKLGRFLPATVQEVRDDTSDHVHVEAYDRCWRVRDNYTTRMVWFARGYSYIDAITQLLIECGIDTVMATPSSEEIASMRQDWPVGTSYLSIVNQLLDEINYRPLHFSGDGAAVLEPVGALDPGRIQHTLDADDIKSLLLPELYRETDIFDAPNVIIALCPNLGAGPPLKAVAENNNPASPLSIARRGRRICRVVQVDNVSGGGALGVYAQRTLMETMISSETIDVRTGLLPGFGVGDIVALHYGDYTAICRERSWSMELRAGGTMTHHLERMVINLDL